MCWCCYGHHSDSFKCDARYRNIWLTINIKEPDTPTFYVDFTRTPRCKQGVLKSVKCSPGFIKFMMSSNKTKVSLDEAVRQLKAAVIPTLDEYRDRLSENIQQLEREM